jgi:ABC-2 type transport system permease protein
MNKTVLVMVQEINTSLRRKTFLLFGFGLPLLLGLAALAVMFVNRDAASPTALSPTVSTSEAIRQGYVDEGHLIQVLPEDVPAERLVAYPDPAAAETALAAETIAGYYVIPADYVQRGHLTYVTRTYSPLSGGVETGTMEWVLLVNLLGGNAALAADIQIPFDLRAHALEAVEDGVAEESWIVEFFPTLMVLLLYMIILMPAGVLVNALTDEKKNRVMEVLVTSVSPTQLLTGKIVALGILGLLQTGVWIGVFWAVLHFGGRPLAIPPGFTVPTFLIIWSLVYFLLGYAIYGALLAGVGALAPDVKETRSATLLVMSPLIVAYTLNIIVVERPGSTFAVALSLFPLTGPVAMIGRLVQTDVPLWQPVLSAALQLLTAVVIVRLVARLFRAQHLLTGQPFSVSRYLSLLAGRPLGIKWTG